LPDAFVTRRNCSGNRLTCRAATHSADLSLKTGRDVLKLQKLAVPWLECQHLFNFTATLWRTDGAIQYCTAGWTRRPHTAGGSLPPHFGPKWQFHL